MKNKIKTLLFFLLLFIPKSISLSKTPEHTASKRVATTAQKAADGFENKMLEVEEEMVLV